MWSFRLRIFHRQNCTSLRESGVQFSRSGYPGSSGSPPTPHSGYLDAADARTQSAKDQRRLRDIMQKSMRIQSTDDRDRLWENLRVKPPMKKPARRHWTERPDTICGCVAVSLHTDAVTFRRCSMKPKPRGVSRRPRSQRFSMSVSCQ